MPVQKVNIDLFMKLAKEHTIIDVRSPGEYKQAHIPGAYSLPLFDNEERKVVGTAYKQQSRETAIKIGLDFFGKKMVKMVEEVEKLMEDKFKMSEGGGREKIEAKPRTILVHCWRGGMRSAGVAWLLDLYGFKVYTLAGGYKVFRNWVLDQFEKAYPFVIIGGYTGSGKTGILHQLRNRGENIIDLEDLAGHKGSAFGNIGLPAQPSQEMFENKLAVELRRIDERCDMTDDGGEAQDSNFQALPNHQLHATTNRTQLTINDRPSTIWIEDESQRIGTVNIPLSLWKQIRTKPLIFLNIPFEERLEYIVSGYGKADKEKLINATIRIQKRLGGLETKTAINFLIEGDLKESFRILLKYYDKYYTKGLRNRENWEELVTEIECEQVDEEGNALKVLGRKIQKENA